MFESKFGRWRKFGDKKEMTWQGFMRVDGCRVVGMEGS
jgi:hypothetical protein